MIYLDQKGHLLSDKSTEELHQFASKMGLRPEWFQAHLRHPHYDLTTPRAKQRAINAGAILISSKEIILKTKGR